MIKKILNSDSFWAFLFGMTLVFLLLRWLDTQAQVVQRGNMFVQLSDSSKSTKIKKDVPTLTGYFYFDSNGVKYPIYVSSNKRCFIMKITKNGKMRRQYFPQITQRLYGRSTEASK